MNTLQIVSIVSSVLGTVIMVVLAWVTIYRINKVEVSFTGTPVDKKDFEKHVEEDHREQDALHSRLGGIERGVEARLTAKINKVEADGNESRRALHRDVDSIGRLVAGLQTASELANERAVLMDAKLDRLIERSK